MSTPTHAQRISVPALRAQKGQEPIAVLTAYTTPVAQALDPHVDILLVGDSLGMVLYGFDSTLQVTIEYSVRPSQETQTAQFTRDF